MDKKKEVDNVSIVCGCIFGGAIIYIIALFIELIKLFLKGV
jgi:hypothetical protein